MARPLAVFVWVLLTTASRLQAPALTFAGIGLRSDLDSVAARFPHSHRADQYLYISPQDAQDHISGIELSGSASTRRARISFETRREDARPDYPTCARIQAQITSQFGKPDRLRQFWEEAMERSDRVWQRGSEELTLICFREPRGPLLAEAVLITPRASKERP